jgi:hypothetical protein
VLPATITKIHQAFKEIKHMAIDTWQEECRFAARRAMKEVLETRMHSTIDAHLEQMRVKENGRRLSIRNYLVCSTLTFCSGFGNFLPE